MQSVLSLMKSSYLNFSDDARTRVIDYIYPKLLLE